MENQAENQVKNQVENQVDNQMDSQAENQVGNAVENQVENAVENQVENQIENQVENQSDNLGGVRAVEEQRRTASPASAADKRQEGPLAEAVVEAEETLDEDETDAKLMELFTSPHSRPAEASHEKLEPGANVVSII